MKENKTIRLSRLLIKIIICLFLINILCFASTFIPIGKLSLYNLVFTGRERFPFGENPKLSYNLTINNLDAMIASHEISGAPKKSDAYRILLIGDSSIWGYLQKPENTLSGILENEINFQCNGQPIEIYNFGYPSLSVLKDAFFLDKARSFNPDLALWFVTLESLNKSDQITTPLVMNNPDELNRIIQAYDLAYNQTQTSLWDHSLFAQRRNFADLARLQFYGVMWAATGIDQEYPATFTPAQRNFEPDASYKNYSNQMINQNDLALGVIQHSIDKISSVDFALVNEPILISKGKNSDIRYDYYYPRWAYDQYRNIMETFVGQNQIEYYDFWNLVPEENFTNSAIHLDSYGEKLLAEKILEIIKEKCLK